MSIWVHTFKVNGKGLFPMDMLRYDRCYPAGPESVAAIVQRTSADGLSQPERRDAVLCHVTSDRHWKPEDGRWTSFGWEVHAHTAHRV